MIEITGNIFDYTDTHWVTITVNQGWNHRGDNVMGAGLALYIKNNYPEITSDYGKFCRDNPGASLIKSYRVLDKIDGEPRRFIMFPTKNLNFVSPNSSWRAKSDINLIERCLPLLAKFGESSELDIMVPLLGCSNGGLRKEDVIPVIKKYLISDKFILIHPPAQVTPY